MKSKQRIPIFIRHINIRQLIVDWFANMKLPTFSINKAIKDITTDLFDITQHWLDNPHLRFSQILTNMGYLPTIPGDWYDDTDEVLLARQNINLEEELEKQKETIRDRAKGYMRLKDAHLDK